MAGVSDIVVNGGFDINNVGWTSNCEQNQNASLVGAGEGILHAPEGHFAWQGKEGTNGSCTFYQDVAIPAGATAATLSLDVGISGSNGNLAPSLDSVSVDVKTTGNVLIANVFTGLRNPYRETAPAPPVNLTAQAGTTVRIVMTLTRGSGSGVVVGALDRVVLNVTTPDPVPTLSEWAMILLGLTLAGGAAIYLQRRARLA